MSTASATAAMMPTLTLPPSLIRKYLIHAMSVGLVPLVTSSPGMGKTEIAASIADEYRLKLIDFRLAQADITDLNGLPEFVMDKNGKRRATFTPFDIFPLEGDELPDHPDGGKYEGWLLMMDELTSAPKHLQAAGYKVILERKIGNYSLHERVRTMGAGNLASDKAVVHLMSTALQSRLIHLEMRVDHKEWMQWAVPKGIDSRVLGYLEFKKDHLHVFNPEHEDKTFACPRTWYFTHKLIHGIPDLTQDDLPMLAGTISNGIASEFLQFCKIYKDLPTLQEIIADPLNCRLPAESSTKYAMTTVIADKLTDSNAKELLTYLRRLPVEMHVITMRTVRMRNNKLMRNPHVQDLFTALGNYT